MYLWINLDVTNNDKYASSSNTEINWCFCELSFLFFYCVWVWFVTKIPRNVQKYSAEKYYDQFFWDGGVRSLNGSRRRSSLNLRDNLFSRWCKRGFVLCGNWQMLLDSLLYCLFFSIYVNCFICLFIYLFYKYTTLSCKGSGLNWIQFIYLSFFPWYVNNLSLLQCMARWSLETTRLIVEGTLYVTICFHG